MPKAILSDAEVAVHETLVFHAKDAVGRTTWRAILLPPTSRRSARSGPPEAKVATLADRVPWWSAARS